jgi:DNA anti-recombination protein RmuC
MVEAEMITIGILGIALIVALWVLATRKDAISNEQIRLVAGEIATVQRRELQDENDRERIRIQTENETMVTTLREDGERQVKTMKDDVGKVSKENIELKTLVDKLSQAQQTTASAVEHSTEVSQRVANALGGDNPVVKRDYGEGKAKEILLACGLDLGTHFFEQPSIAPYEGNQSGKSPDYILMLSGGAATAIDCKAIMKAGFNAFYEIDGEEDAQKKKNLLNKHANDVWSTVTALAERNYPLGLEKQYGIKGPDYTLMFIPSDEFLYRAELGVSDKLRDSMGYNTLREAAIRRRVFLCSPDSLAMKAIDLLDHWKSTSKLDEVNDVLDLVQEVVEAVVDSEESKAAHHKAIQDLLSTWNSHVKNTESTHGGRKRPSLRVALTNLFGKVSSKQPSTVRGKKGARKEPISIETINTEPISPTKTNPLEIHVSSRISAAIVEEEE